MKKILDILVKIRFITIFLILCVFCWIFSCYGNDVISLFGFKWRPWVMKESLGSCFLFKYTIIGICTPKIFRKTFFTKRNCSNNIGGSMCSAYASYAMDGTMGVIQRTERIYCH